MNDTLDRLRGGREPGGDTSRRRHRVSYNRNANPSAFPFRAVGMARGFTIVGCAILSILSVAGCGNQMLRQPSFTPLDTPRAAPPAGAVMLRADLAPEDAKPVHTEWLGDLQASPAVDDRPAPNAALPPPNLSDTARFDPTPAAVNALKNPLPTDPRVVRAGHVMFLNRCVQCHNSSGIGYGTVGQYLLPHPPDLASDLVQRRSDGAMYWHITNGQGKMPPFRTWTTPTQRWELVAFVRSLGAHRIPNANVTASTDPSDAPRIGPIGGSDTQTAPYPVYGLPGFEEGKTGEPFKVLPAQP